MNNGKQPRGCGDSRDAGGIYLECGSEGGGGIPMNFLIQDPITPIDPAEYGIAPVGVKLIEMDGIWHVFDWVGASHYPNAADFLEEAIRLGLSRRISKAEDFSKLTAESRLILIHPKAYVSGFETHEDIPCPTGKHEAMTTRKGIQEAGVLWLVGDRSTLDLNAARLEKSPCWAPFPVEPYEAKLRTMPAFDYNLAPAPDGVTFSPGIIMVAPIERIAVVKDPNDPEYTEAAKETAEQAGLPVTLEDE
jgi:hypothetical protein